MIPRNICSRYHIMNKENTIDLKMEDSFEIENNNIPDETGLVGENITDHANSDTDVNVKEEFIPEECFPEEIEAPKIEITEHGLALENMPALEDIYKEYNENEARVNISHTISLDIGDHSTKKLVKKASSRRRKKVVETNTLDSFVHNTRIEKKTNSKDMVERLFIRLERINFSNKLNSTSVTSKNLKVSKQDKLGADQRKEKTGFRSTEGLKLNKSHGHTKNSLEGETDNCVINKKNNKLFAQMQKTLGTYVKDTSNNEVPEQIFGKYLPIISINKGLDGDQGKKKVDVVEYQCYHCNAVFKRRKGLVNHMNKWHRGPRKEVSKQEFQCYHCGKVVLHRKSLINHLNQLHTEGEKKFHCDSCTYKTNLKQALLNHVYRVHVSDDQKPTFKCEFCPRETKVKADLRFHVNRVHLKKKKIIKCEQCDWEGDSVRLVDHKKHKHSGQELACDKCSFKTKNKNNLALHQRTHTEEKPFSCPICPYKSRFTIGAHMRTHQLIYKKCPDCFRMVKESSWYTHIKLYHKGDRRKEKCPQCGKEVFSLKKHLQTHNGGYTKIKCPDCFFTSTNNCYMKNHIRECHENKKREPVTCYRCNKQLADKTCLIYHLRTVHTTDPCDCPICGKTLSSKLYLSGHLGKVHVPLLECDLCPEGSRYKTKNKRRFERHKVLHLTGEALKMYKCDYCPYENKVLPNLHRHLVKHHKRETKKMKDKS